MKKKILAVVLSVVLAFAIPSALAGAYYNLPLDVGNFNDYGGGGDWDYGGNYDYGDTYDYNDDWNSSNYSGETSYSSGHTSSESDFNWNNPFDVALFIGILFVLLLMTGLANRKSSKSKKKQQPKQTPKRPYSSYETPQNFMPKDFTTSITELIKQTDPDFSSEKFIAWSKNIFITLQTAWTERDWEKIRTIEKEELFEMHNTQLQEYIRLGRINYIERINVNQAFLHKYVRDENYENLTVCMKVRMIDYIVDEKTNKVLNGSNKDDVFMTYLLTFLRRKGTKTTLINGVISNSCPHCGAPVDSASAGKCKYCGSVVHSGEFNWVLSDMQAVKPGFKNDNRGIILLDEGKK